MLPVEKLGSKPLPSAAISTVNVPPGWGGSSVVLVVPCTWAIPATVLGVVALVSTLDFLAVVPVVFLAVVGVPPLTAAVGGVVSPVAVVDVLSPRGVDVSPSVDSVVLLLVFFLLPPPPHAAATNPTVATTAMRRHPRCVFTRVPPS